MDFRFNVSRIIPVCDVIKISAQLHTATRIHHRLELYAFAYVYLNTFVSSRRTRKKLFAFYAFNCYIDIEIILVCMTKLASKGMDFLRISFSIKD